MSNFKLVATAVPTLVVRPKQDSQSFYPKFSEEFTSHRIGYRCATDPGL